MFGKALNFLDALVHNKWFLYSTGIILLLGSAFEYLIRNYVYDPPSEGFSRRAIEMAVIGLVCLVRGVRKLWNGE